MQALLYCCCGVDVHDEMIETCIVKGFEDEPEIIRKQFQTMPKNLYEFAAYLNEHECYNIAMESTGIYWRPVYEVIEDYCGSNVQIVVTNASHMRNIPGRKNDVDDAEWIATLLQHGLLKSSFVPERIFRDLREASRLYRKLVGERSRYTNRIGKLLQAHGFKLSNVLSDILGASGRNILKVLAERGSLSISVVESCLRGRPKHTPHDIHVAISGSLNSFERKILSVLLNKVETAEHNLNELFFDMKEKAAPYHRQLSIIDSVPGFDILASLLLLSEISSTPYKSFRSADALCSWAGLSPRNDESAGKIKSRKTLPRGQYVKSILVQAAWSAVRSRENPFRDWFWSHKGKMGEKKALIAVSRQLLKTIYTLLSNNTLYDNDIAIANRKRVYRPNSKTE